MVTIELQKQRTRWEKMPVLNQAKLTHTSGGDNEFAREVLWVYFSSMPRALRELWEAYSAGEKTEVRYRARMAKGSCELVGAQRLAAILLSLEMALEIGDAEFVAKLVSDELDLVWQEAKKLDLVINQAAA